MRTLLRIVGAWALGIGLVFIALQNAVAADRTILVFGDSLSAAYGIRPEAGLGGAARAAPSRARVRVPGRQRQRERRDQQRRPATPAPGAAELTSPRIVILELGANDGLRGLPLSGSRQNLAQMVRLSQAAGARVLLVGMRMPPNYGPRYTEEFARIFPDLANQYHLPLVPFLLDHVALDPELMQEDGLHPNAKGEPRILDNVWPHLQPLLNK